MPNVQPNSSEQSFESAVAELDAIVQAMESGSLPLEEALSQYQRGVEIIRRCQATLNAAEQKIRILEGDTLVPFDAQKEN